mmetsp:Transcript_23915/g.59836  ORF Transcript_23915/g.59836 Transcript_23915/m.59836 type:complete len:262 (+) Transcript_23915:372-1157(+)
MGVPEAAQQQHSSAFPFYVRSIPRPLVCVWREKQRVPRRPLLLLPRHWWMGAHHTSQVCTEPLHLAVSSVRAHCCGGGRFHGDIWRVRQPGLLLPRGARVQLPDARVDARERELNCKQRAACALPAHRRPIRPHHVGVWRLAGARGRVDSAVCDHGVPCGHQVLERACHSRHPPAESVRPRRLPMQEQHVCVWGLGKRWKVLFLRLAPIQLRESNLVAGYLQLRVAHAPRVVDHVHPGQQAGHTRRADGARQIACSQPTGR